MIDRNVTLVFSQPISGEFLAQIKAGGQAGRRKMLPHWQRTGAFLAAFIVLPGILGFLMLTSDRFNVGFMVGGFSAMVLDGYFMAHKFPGGDSRQYKIFKSRQRSVGKDGVSLSGDGWRTDLVWPMIVAVHRFPDGIALQTKSRKFMPISFAELPAPATAADLENAIQDWRGLSPDKASA